MSAIASTGSSTPPSPAYTCSKLIIEVEYAVIDLLRSIKQIIRELRSWDGEFDELDRLAAPPPAPRKRKLRRENPGNIEITPLKLEPFIEERDKLDT